MVFAGARPPFFSLISCPAFGFLPDVSNRPDVSDESDKKLTYHPLPIAFYFSHYSLLADISHVCQTMSYTTGDVLYDAVPPKGA